jgi:membrane protease subunit HflK
MPWNDIWQKIVGQVRGGRKWKPVKMGPVVWIVIGIVVAIWLASGIYVVGPAERGVVTQFGRFVSLRDPGLNYRLPWPIQAHHIVNVEEIRRAEIGFRTVEEPGRPARHVRVLDEEARMLTGDRNIADVQILVFYQVQDPVKYLFRAEAPELALRVNTEVALRSVVGQMPIDYAMTVGRPTIEVRTSEFLQSLLDDHLTGLRVVGVELQPVRPPDEVAEAFYDVIRAKADRERLIMEAEGYFRDVVPRARGDAAAIVHAATAYRDERIALAEGEAQRFTLVLEEYRRAPEVTRRRLFLEAIERILAGTEKFIIDPAVGGGLIQFLPLVDLEPGAVVAPGGGE